MVVCHSGPKTPLHSGKMTTPESNGLFLGLKHFENGWNFNTPSLNIQKKCQKVCNKNWSKTANSALSIYSKKTLPLKGGHPPTTRWSTQRANDRYRGNLDGQLTSPHQAHALYVSLQFRRRRFLFTSTGGGKNLQREGPEIGDRCVLDRFINKLLVIV